VPKICDTVASVPDADGIVVVTLADKVFGWIVQWCVPLMTLSVAAVMLLNTGEPLWPKLLCSAVHTVSFTATCAQLDDCVPRLYLLSAAGTMSLETDVRSMPPIATLLTVREHILIS